MNRQTCRISPMNRHVFKSMIEYDWHKGKEIFSSIIGAFTENDTETLRLDEYGGKDYAVRGKVKSKMGKEREIELKYLDEYESEKAFDQAVEFSFEKNRLSENYPVQIICLCKEDVFPCSKEYVNKAAELNAANEGKRYNLMRMITIELDKAKKQIEQKELTEMSLKEKWVYFLNYYQDSDKNKEIAELAVSEKSIGYAYEAMERFG